MKKKILFRYIFSEIYPLFLTSLFIAVFIVISTKMFSLIEMVVSHGAKASHIIKILFYLVPEVLLFSLPAATLISVLIAFLRFSSDNEIIALKASGISLYYVLPPVIALSFIAFLLSLFISLFLVPWGNRNLRELLFQVVKKNANVGIKERVFCEPFKGIILYVNHFSPNRGIMKGVFVVDKRDKREINTIVAEKGRIINWPNRDLITFHFSKGTIFSTDRDFRSIKTIEFYSYDLNMDIGELNAGRYSLKRKPKEMSLNELLHEIRRKDISRIKHNLAIIELMERFSIPVGVFLMGIIAVPIGMQIKIKNRTIAVGVGILIFFIYYILLAAVKGISETGYIPPAFSMWIPDIFLLTGSIYLIKLAETDKEIRMPPFLTKIKRVIKK